MLRAWEDNPLDRNGELDAQIAAQKIARYNPVMIYSDDLTRAMQTAAIISKTLANLPTEVDYGLRTADMGEWTAQPEREVAPQVLQWYSNPWEKSPGGESYNDFVDRFFDSFDKKVDLSRRVKGFNPLVTVMHGRNFAALNSRYDFIAPKDTRMPLPGGIALIRESMYGHFTNMEFIGPTEPVLTDA